MRARIDVDADGLAAEIEKELARDVTASVREATNVLKTALRDETWRAFSMSNRLPLAWRGKVYPQGRDSVEAAGYVAVRGSAAKIIETALQATVIRARGGRWLAVPTDAAGKQGLRAGFEGGGGHVNRRGARERVTPAGFERRTGLKLRFVPEKGGRRAFLVVDGAMRNRATGIAAPYRQRGRGSRLYGPAGHTIVVFTLVPQVTTRKRMDLDAIAEEAGATVAGLIVMHRSR
ncbi:DUF6441 family protein [Brevundimonas faecalis]|uniref:Uncharacterized protein n=1 Tax=Brevundimonas faecalis TaxID=947378 RepID=A0ABV2RAT0_9CAUL